MSSSALPPLAGVSSTGAKDDREEQRTQKVKPLPLMLSSRAPLVQAVGSGLPVSSPGQGASRSRPHGGQQQQQAPQAPHLTHPPGPDVPPPSPGSPTAQQAAALRNSSSSKFTRIRGFQGGQSQGPMGLEGSGLLHPPPAQQPSQQQQQQQQPGVGAGGHGDSGQQQQHHHSWDGGAGSPSRGASPPRLASGGRTLAAAVAAAGGGGGSSGGAGAAAESWQHANGGSGGGAAAPHPGPSSSSLWATRRSGLGAGPGPGAGPGAVQTLHLGALGSPGGTIALAAIGSAPLGVRSSAAAASAAAAAKHLSQLGAAGFPLPPHLHAGPGRPDTAPSASPLDPLASATFPASTVTARAHSLSLSPHHGLSGPLGLVSLVPVAAINPPLRPPIAWPTADGAGGGGGDELYGSGGGAPQPGPSVAHSQDVAMAGLEAGSPRPSLPPRGPPNGPLALEQPPPSAASASASASAAFATASSSAAALLQRLYRTNRTPPSQTEGLQDLFSQPRHGSPAGGRTPVVGGAGGVSRADSPAPPGGGGAAAASLSGAAVAAAASRPGTTATVGSVGGGSLGPSLSVSGSGAAVAALAQRPRGRGAAAGTLADLSAALQKSIAAGMGEWDLRADGNWGHPEVQQRLLRGPLGPEALKTRYRMEERDIIALYRLLYSYSVGFFTDVEALLEGAVADRSSGAAVGLAAGSGLRQELLENVFRAYATLWDEALMIVFDSEMTSMLADKNAALRALDRGAVQLETLRREKEELQTRLEDFMKQNVDNMLASRHLQQAATRLEGEVYTLHNANEQLVTNMARHAVHVATLERQLEAARAATEAAEGRAGAAEAHLGDLKAIVSDQNATLSSQFFQIKELERMCGELQDTVRNLNRRRAAVLGLLSGNNPEQSEPGAGAAAATSISATNSVASTGAGAAVAAPAHPSAAGPRTSALTGGAAVASPGPSPLGGGSSLRPLGSGSGAASSSGAVASAAARPGTGDGGAGVARPGTPTPRAPSPSPSTAPLAPALDSATEGVLADMSLLDPDELGRLLSDKTRAFNLMHADFVVKMHELDEQRSLNESLRAEVSAMQSEVARSEAATEASRRTAAQFRAKYETGRMAMEDLEEKNRKLTHKNAELVRSYWPLMTRLKEAEAEAAKCREEAARDREAAAADRAEADTLRAAAADTAAALQELEERRAEAASHELELPPDLLALLPEGHASTLRRFGRSCHRRIAHLNSQVVGLVDQVTQLRLDAVMRREEQVLAGGGAGAGAEPAGGGDGGGGGGGGGGDAVAAAEELVSLRAALAVRDKWLAVLGRGMSGLMANMENLMARDWETCRTLRLEQDRRRKKAAREAARAAARAAAASGDGGGGGGGGSQLGTEASSTGSGIASGIASPERSAVSLRSTQSAGLPTVGEGAVGGGGGGGSGSGGSPSAEPSAAALSDPVQQGGSGAVSAEASLVSGGGGGAAGPASPRVREAGGGEDGDGEGDEEEAGGGGGDESLSVAAGRLAQLLGPGGGAEGVERTPQLVALDRAFERLAESSERMIEWSEGLLRRKEQTSTFSQVRHKLESVSRQYEAAMGELASLRPTAEALRHSVRGYEVKFKEMSATTAVCKQRAETAESRLESVEAQLAVVTAQLREAQDAQKLLENEYWKAKDVALEAEVTTGELKAGRIRALEAAAKAVASVSGLEKEARENRDQRVALEADLVGYKAWVRHMEALERKHRATLRELADARGACEERDRKLGELRDRISTLEQQLRFKSLEASSLESRVKALSGELVEERRAGRAAVAEARASAAVQLDAAIRQAGGAEAEAAAQAERVAVLEGRLSELTRELDAAAAAAAAAEGRLVPLTAERDRLRTHLAASQTLLAAMDRAAEAIGRRLASLEDRLGGGDGGGGGSGSVRFGLVGGSLDLALEGLLAAVDAALDACGAVAAEAAGDGVPALLAALEGLAGQLLATLSKGGKEPIQSLAVLKAQLARDDKELAALRAAMAEVAAAREEAAREAAEQRAAAAAAAKAAAAATAAAARDGFRAATAEAALVAARRDLDATVRQLAEARLAAEAAKRQAERSAKRSSELESDLASAHSQRRHHEATAAAAAQKAGELKRRAEECEEEAARDRDAAREARERAAAAEAAAEAAALRASQLEAAVEAEAREAARARADAAEAVAAAAEARDKAVTVEQAMLETQSKYADMIRHDEAIEERLRAAQFEADNMRKRAAEAATEAAEAVAAYEALQQRAWQLQVALAAKAGEKEEALRELVEATHGTAARRAALTTVGSASVKQRAEGSVQESAGSFKTKRTVDG